MEFFTIGVYHSTEKEFFDKLIRNRIDTFCDIRQRRGVRGAQYAFANSNRLQEKLDSLEIHYVYVAELAPTTEMRETQYKADAEKGVGKRDRQELGAAFVAAYENKVLEKFDFNVFLENLEQVNARKVVLFCVEEHAEACHRSIVTDRLRDMGYKITHL